MIKYKADIEKGEIKKVECTKETLSQVFFDDWAQPKISDSYGFFDTFEEAKIFLIQEKEDRKWWHYKKLLLIDMQISELNGLNPA